MSFHSQRLENVGTQGIHLAWEQAHVWGGPGERERRSRSLPLARVLPNVSLLAGYDPSRLLIISPVPQPISSTVYHLHSLQKVIHRRNGEGRRLSDRFREQLREVEKDDKNASKRSRHTLKLPNHSKQYMVVCGLSLHQGSMESHTTLEQH